MSHRCGSAARGGVASAAGGARERDVQPQNDAPPGNEARLREAPPGARGDTIPPERARRENPSLVTLLTSDVSVR